jgi:hypothetical protein
MDMSKIMEQYTESEKSLVSYKIAYNEQLNKTHEALKNLYKVQLAAAQEMIKRRDMEIATLKNTIATLQKVSTSNTNSENKVEEVSREDNIE